MDEPRLRSTTNRPSKRTALSWLLIAANVIALGIVVVLAPGLAAITSGLLLASFLVVGSILVLKLPDNPEAWLLLIVSTAWSFAFLVPFDGGWVPAVMLMTTQLLLRFPNGSLPSPRWQLFSRATLGLVVVLTFVITSGDTVTEAGESNAYYVSWAHWFAPVLALLPLSMVICAISLIVRYRRAGLVEREQIRWLAWAAATVATIYIVTLGFSLHSPWNNDNSTWIGLLRTGALMSFALLPLSIGVAVLKYRLYDIDRIISRTTSYAVVTGVVLATYGGVVTLGTRWLPGSSSWAVATGTLVAAAAFRPLLRRVQTIVDKRFNRERYDAARTVDQFGSELGRTVHPEAVSDDLIRAVQRVLEPSSTRLWLKGSS